MFLTQCQNKSTEFKNFGKWYFFNGPSHPLSKKWKLIKEV